MISGNQNEMEVITKNVNKCVNPIYRNTNDIAFRFQAGELRVAVRVPGGHLSHQIGCPLSTPITSKGGPVLLQAVDERMATVPGDRDPGCQWVCRGEA